MYDCISSYASSSSGTWYIPTSITAFQDTISGTTASSQDVWSIYVPLIHQEEGWYNKIYVQDWKVNEELKKAEKAREEAIKRARLLLENIMPEENEKLNSNKRLEIVSRNGQLYEILADGRVNKLLSNGQKEGLCFNAIGEWLPTEDIILMKKMLLEECSELVEEKANKVTPFPIPY